MVNIFKVVFVIIGAIIGAGFASGQEIYIFFYSYGVNGIIGFLCTSVLLGIIIYVTLNIIIQEKIEKYEQFICLLEKKKSCSKQFNFGYIMNIIINIFLLISFYIMIAGFGAYFYQELGISKYIGSFILAVSCFFIFLGNTKWMIKVNEILVPLLIISIVGIGIKNIINLDFSKYLNIQNYCINAKWILSSIIYSSYNTILLIPVLNTLKNEVKNKKSIALISAFSTIIFFVLGSTIFLILEKVDVDISTVEMPLVYVIGKKFNRFKLLYGFIILISILTTSISIGISFLSNVAKSKRSFPQIASIMCITSLIICNIGFSNLVNKLFPIFGYLGLIQIFYIFMLKKR